MSKTITDVLARLTPEQKDDALAYLAGFAYQLSTYHVHGPNKSRWLSRMADTCPPAADLIRAVQIQFAQRIYADDRPPTRPSLAEAEAHITREARREGVRR